MIRNVKPTRMELLKTRRKIELAKKGHKLLKEKRDALFNEFFRETKPAKEMRQQLEQGLGNAFGSLSIAMAQLGRETVAENALAASRMGTVNIELGEKNVMGATIPRLETRGEIRRNIVQRGYSITGTGSSLDDAARAFEESLEKILSLAEKEALLEKLSLEINKTKRKVNSLEKVTIPRLEETKKYISQRLEERERETFFTLKKVKGKKEAKQKVS